MLVLHRHWFDRLLSHPGLFKGGGVAEAGAFHTPVRGTMFVGSGAVTPGSSHECDITFFVKGRTESAQQFHDSTAAARRERHRTVIPSDTRMLFPWAKVHPLKSRLSFNFLIQNPRTPERVSKAFPKRSLKGSLKGSAEGPFRTPSKRLQEPFKTPSRRRRNRRCVGFHFQGPGGGSCSRKGSLDP